MTAETPLKSYHSHKYSLNFQQIEKTGQIQLASSSAESKVFTFKCEMFKMQHVSSFLDFVSQILTQYFYSKKLYLSLKLKC